MLRRCTSNTVHIEHCCEHIEQVLIAGALRLLLIEQARTLLIAGAATLIEQVLATLHGACFSRVRVSAHTAKHADIANRRS